MATKRSGFIKEPEEVIKLDSDGVIIEAYSSIEEAAFKNKISAVNLINHLKGRQKTAAGYKWKYKPQ